MSASIFNAGGIYRLITANTDILSAVIGIPQCVLLSEFPRLQFVNINPSCHIQWDRNLCHDGLQQSKRWSYYHNHLPWPTNIKIHGHTTMDSKQVNLFFLNGRP